MAAVLHCAFLAWCLLWSGALQAQPADPQAVHIVQAQMFSRPSLGFTPPPYVLGADGQGGAWTAVDLPHAEPPQVQMRPPQDPPLTTEVWYRLAVPALAQEASPLYLYLPR